jgi:hypothetical protein
MTDPNESAYPNKVLRGSVNYVEQGLTKREYFASKALQGLLGIYDSGQNAIVPNEENVIYMGKLAVKAADALIAELNKPNR